MTARLLYLALDACDSTIAHHLIDEGRMPTLAALRERSGCTPIATNPVHLVGGTWVSFWTGLEPIDHGFWSDWRYVPGTHTDEKFLPSAIEPDPFWNDLGSAGHVIGAFDVPLTDARPVDHGVVLSEWGAHDRFVNLCSWPPEYGRQVVARYGAHVDEIPCNLAVERGPRSVFLDRLHLGIDQKKRLLVDELQDRDWDLFMGVFGESHCAGHQFWHAHDPTHPLHPEAIADGVVGAIEDVYVALDRALGEVIDAAGDDAQIWVHLSHGMGPHYDATSILPEILRALARHETTSMARLVDGARTWSGRVIRRSHRAWRKARGIPRPPRRRALPTAQPWFALYNNDKTAAIRLNVIGREPHGVVPPERIDETLDGLIDDLRALRNIDTGAPVTAEIARLSDVYGDRTHPAAPDLFVTWDNSAPIRGVRSPKTGEIRGGYDGPRTGDHVHGGSLFTRGSIADASTAEIGRIEDFAAVLSAACRAASSQDGAT